jgi:DNA polymerase elongation subunit (family B)
MSVTKKAIGKYFRLIDFHVYDNKEEDGSENDSNDGSPSNAQFTIQMFGLNESGDTCSVTINDYEPFFYIKVGDDWDQGIANQLLDEIKKKIWKHAPSVLSIQIVDYHKLYGFSGGKKCRFVKITFSNMAAFNRVKGLWYKYDEETNQRKANPFVFQDVKLQLYESNIPPLLRYFHLQNISPSGWVLIHTPKCSIPQPKTTTCKFEYICSQKCVKPAPEKETRVPYKICSFDIEASSSHGDFPLPKKTYKRLATNIVDAFQRQISVLTTTAAQKKFITKAIMAAFTYDRMDDIDLIYTEGVRPEKADIKTMIDILLETKIDIASATKEESTIESMFEKMKEQQSAVGVENDDEDAEETDEPTVLTPKKKEVKPKKAKKETPDTFIYDLLSSDEFTREKKIIGLNKLLTPNKNDESKKQFPKVEGDKVTFIGSTFLKYGDSTPYLNHCVVLDTCDPVEGVEILSVDTEDKVLTEWAKLIQRENPDIIIGYNIFGFDYEFMFQRALETGCHEPFLQLSRKRGEICGKKDKEEGWKLDNTQLKIASGEYDLRYPTMSGRLQIDLYAYFRRDFNLTSYKLDDVAGQYISDEIKKTVITEHGNTQIYSKNLAGLHVDDFIHIKINSFSSDYFNNGQKFKVITIDNGVEHGGKKYNVITIAGAHEIPEPSGSIVSIDWGMAKDDVTPQDIFRLTRGSSADRAIVAKYCIQDCNLVHHLMSKLDVITGYTEMSSICSVPITFLVFRGQGIKLTSYVAKKCRDKNTLMPDLDKSCGNEGYEGAIVLPPKCSMYIDNPVACVDYSSLYPSSMISQNYSHDSKVWSKEYDMSGKLIKVTGEQDKKGNFIYDNMPGYHYINIEFKTYKYLRRHPMAVAKKTQIGTKVCRWAQLPNNQKSIMPSILTELLDARAATRKKAKSEPDPFMQNILDKRQLGYKVTANSLYGQCGAKTSTFYDMDVAASTTATGQMMITYAKRMIEEVYGDSVYETAKHGIVKCNAEYVYGDTDSVFFTFNLTNPETGEKIRGKPALEMTIEIAQEAAQLCTSYLKPPMGLAYEKTLMPFILLSKKRYVGMLYEDDPNDGYLKFMGLVLKRRDNCDLVKDVYGGILHNLMNSTNIQLAIDFLNKSLEELIQGKIPMDKLSITKALRGDYKNPAAIAHRVLADRIAQRDPGNKPKPGDRIKYVYFNNKGAKLQGDKIETPEFIVERGLQIDYTHYITNQLMKPLQQLFGLAIEQIWELQNKGSAIKTFKKDMAQLHAETEGDLEVFMKKREKYTSAKIKMLLFDKFLTKIFNQQNGVRTMNEFFVSK